MRSINPSNSNRLPVTLLLIQANRTGVSVGTIQDCCRRGFLDPQRDSAGGRLLSEADTSRVRKIYVANTLRQRRIHNTEPGEDG